ncbi:MAG: sigma 54-interacting transcriptional regulator [Deltaproteobacteria bacterium]|nr:sigma 54-interacting transcriptional regulator [Deltaproteobacteria bacterium]
MRKKGFTGIIGTSPTMLRLLDFIRIIAPKDVKVLIRGERGTGKELVANAIHRKSLRKNMPFIKVNCAVLSRDLLASELFGHVKGSFTGAISTRTGLVMAADGGTLFLDEIGDLSPDAQAAILRFLQEGEVRPIGSLQTFQVDVRVISATNKNLKEAMERGTFREDLYDRLNGFSLEVPPLRDRREDIPDLVGYLVEKYNQKYDEDVSGFTREAMALLMDCPWKGNVRELENVVSRAVILSQGKSRIGLKQIFDILPDMGIRFLGNSKQEVILKIIKEKGKITVKDLQPRLGISDRAIRNHLSRMVTSGLLKTEGGKKNKCYTLP